jgi:hypothetical protein
MLDELALPGASADRKGGSMDSAARAAEALSGLQSGLRADGADLVLEDVRDGVAHVRLIVGPETCEECIVPKAMLEPVVLMALQDGDPTITSVSVDDPREPPQH